MQENVKVWMAGVCMCGKMFVRQGNAWKRQLMVCRENDNNDLLVYKRVRISTQEAERENVKWGLGE